MQKKPIIGINTDYRPVRKDSIAHYCCAEAYAARILTAGGIPVLIPTMTVEEDLARIVGLLDALVLIGGGDLDPKRMGLLPHPACRPVPAQREDCDRLLCRIALRQRLPLLAIGLGMQTLNVVAGGTLFQHIPEDVPRSIPHDDPLGGPHRHALVIVPRTRIEHIYGDGEIRVNSSHHQAVRKAAPGFKVTATGPDGVVEAIETEEKDWFCLGVQWHPESETASALDMQVFEEFLAACKARLGAPRKEANGTVNGHASPKTAHQRADAGAAAVAGPHGPPSGSRRKSRAVSVLPR